MMTQLCQKLFTKENMNNDKSRRGIVQSIWGTRASRTKSAGKGSDRRKIIGGRVKDKQELVTWLLSDFVISRLSLRIGPIDYPRVPQSFGSPPAASFFSPDFGCWQASFFSLALRRCSSMPAVYASLSFSYAVFLLSSSRHWWWTATTTSTTLAPSPFSQFLLFFSLIRIPVCVKSFSCILTWIYH